jgi:hypothetical protein
MKIFKINKQEWAYDSLYVGIKYFLMIKPDKVIK